MNFDEQQIEATLRTAPRPEPPRGLKEQLIAQTRSTGRASQQFSVVSGRDSWLRRWWPALLPATLSLACAAVITVQRQEIRQLEQSVQRLASETAASEPGSQNDVPAPNVSSESVAAQEQEIARLKEQVSALTAEISGLEKLRTENQNLRSQLAAPSASGLTADETADFAAAREKAMRVACINNMKQIGLAARIWAGDNNDQYPPNIVCLSNELNTPKLLICPADSNHQVAPNFQSYSDANCSYECFLKPTGTDSEPTRVLTRCPIHGAVGLYDGSVQTVATNRPADFVERYGKLYYEPPGMR